MKAENIGHEVGKRMDIKTAISEVVSLCELAESISHIEAGEFPEDILSDEFRAFISSLGSDQYYALLDLYLFDSIEGKCSMVEAIQKLVNSFSDEQIELYGKIC